MNGFTVLALLIVICNIKNRHLLDVTLCIKRMLSCTNSILGKRMKASGRETDKALGKWIFGNPVVYQGEVKTLRPNTGQDGFLLTPVPFQTESEANFAKREKDYSSKN